MILSPIRLLLAIAAPPYSSTAAAGADEKTRQPDILWILAENRGLDLGGYGTPLVKTPRVDQLATDREYSR